MQEQDPMPEAPTREEQERAQEELYAAYREAYEGVQYDLVPIADISIPGYQREHYAGHVRNIVANFVPSLVTPPLVNKVTGRRKAYEAVDGQHTIEVLRTIGCTKIKCRVVDMTYQSAAQAFGAQTHKPLKRQEKFYSRVESGDKQAIEIKNAMERAGFTPMRAGYNGKRLQVQAMFEIEKTARLYGIEHLEMALKFIKKTWPVEAKKESGYFIRAIADYLSRYPNITDAQVVKLQEATPQNYLNAGKDMGAQDKRVEAIVLALRTKSHTGRGRLPKRSIWFGNGNGSKK